MPWNHLIGIAQELRVKKWLSQKGFKLISLNWNCSYGEVDIIASFFDQLHFIAVATKKCAENALPSEGITRKKMLACKQAAQKYMDHHPRWKKIIFDVLAISPEEELETREFILIENIRTI
jgi:putative endonuclease